MRKFCTIIGVLIVVLALITEIVLPSLISSMLKDRISQLTYSQEVDLSIDSSPRFMIATGRVDTIKAEVVGGRIGELETSDLTLEASDVHVDMSTLLNASKEEGRRRTVEDYLSSVGSIKMIGLISEDNLKKFLESRVSQLDNLQVRITPDEITATSNVSIMGRSADLELSGTIIADGGDLYFHMTRLNAKNALLRHVHLDRFFGDIKIADAAKLPIGLKFESVELSDGQALLTAVKQ